ncbi:MAG: MATE family efflux transporter [Erysipelotrichaceae bacterium]|nr:MATE family efflux transporter [Erysipelotrichaceae bacterium]
MSEKKKIGIDVTEGNISEALIRYALPILLANVIQQLYNSTDMIIVGQYLGNTGTVGVSQGGEFATLFTFIASSFSTAGQIYIAQLSGAKDRKGIIESVGTLLSLLLCISIAIMGICILFANSLLGWLKVPEEALADAKTYMITISFGLPFVFGYSAIGGILRGLGESKKPLRFVLISAVTNIVLDLMFIVVLNWGVFGSALATVLAQFGAFAAAYLFFQRNSEHLGFELSLKNLQIKKKHLIKYVQLGIPLTMQSAFIHFTQLLCTRRINSFGIIASSTNSIGNKINKFINIFANSVTGGSGAMIAQNIGAGKYERVKQIVHTTLRICITLYIPELLLCVFFPDKVFALFTKDPDVRQMGITYMRIAIITFTLAVIQGPHMAVVTGAGDSKVNFIAGMMDGVVLRLGISFFLAYQLGMGVKGFFLGNALARLGPASIGLIYYLSGIWKNRRFLEK